MSQVTLALIILGLIILAFFYKKIGGRGLTALALIVTVALGGLWFTVHSFQTFSSREKIASVHCSTIANEQHTMAIDMNGTSYTLGGDRWQLQTSVVEVVPWLQFLGVKSGYTLDRLDSQFDDPNHATVRPIQLGGFSLYKSTELWRYIPIIKSSYGNAVIQNCDNRTYSVFVDSSGDMSSNRS